MKKLSVSLLLISLIFSSCANKNVIKYGSTALGATGGAMMGGMFGLLLSGGGVDKEKNYIIPLSLIVGGVIGGLGGMALGEGINHITQ